MKKRKLVVCIVAMFVTLFCYGQEFKHDGSVYKILSENEVELIRLNRKGLHSKIKLSSWVKRRGKTYKVASIHPNFVPLFSKRMDMFSLTLPECLTSVTKYNFSSLGLTRLVVPQSVRKIEPYSFAHMPYLIDVELGDSIQTIEHHAFSGDGDLHWVRLGKGVERIHFSAFNLCRNLFRINLDLVKYIGCRAFENTDLDSISLESLERVDSAAFSRCRGLQSVTFSEKLKYIGDRAFACNSAMRSLFIPADSIGIGAFLDCSSLNEVYMTDQVKYMGEKVFFMCTGLNSVLLSNNISVLNDGVFAGCLNLRDIELPKSLTYIGKYAFAKTGLESLIIPKSVIFIDDGAFKNCSDLRKIFIANPNIKLGKDVFDKKVQIEYREM